MADAARGQFTCHVGESQEYRIGRLTYSFSSKSVTIRSRTRLLTTALFFLSRVDKDIFVL